MINLAKNGEFRIAADIVKVQKLLSKELKPGRALVSVVRFEDGKMSEVHAEVEDQAPIIPIESKRKATLKGVAKVAATVAAPVRGCPAPDFERADLRATRVLSAFVNEEQMADFRKHNRFVSTGADTGHRYMVTSRHASDSLAHYHRTLFDLDEQRPYCVHDWDVPAAEEMLALHLFLQMPGRERYLREIPE